MRPTSRTSNSNLPPGAGGGMPTTDESARAPFSRALIDPPEAAATGMIVSLCVAICFWVVVGLLLVEAMR